MSLSFAVSEVVPVYRNPRFSGVAIREPEQIATLAREIIGLDYMREHFIVFHLDGYHQVINYNVAGVGTANSCLIMPRDVFQCAILNGAVSIVICHNHPSGNLKPSREDISITREIYKVGEMLRIRLLDHVLITQSEHISMRETEDFPFC